MGWIEPKTDWIPDKRQTEPESTIVSGTIWQCWENW